MFTFSIGEINSKIITSTESQYKKEREIILQDILQTIKYANYLSIKGNIDFKIKDTSNSNYANNNYPDNIILLENIELENLNKAEVTKQLGLEETEVSFISKLKKGGNPLKNIKYNKEKIIFIMDNGKEVPLHLTNSLNFKIKDNYWNDLQENIINAIRNKNGDSNKIKKYLTKETGLLINVAHKIVPQIIVEQNKNRYLSSPKEVKDFSIQFVNELEKRLQNKQEKLCNLSFVFIYFSVIAKISSFEFTTYNIVLPCFQQGIYQNIRYSEKNNVEIKRYKIKSLLNPDTESTIKFITNRVKIEK